MKIKQKYVYSSNFSCPESGFTIDEIEPRLFSFNNPAGACKECDGLGYSRVLSEDLIIPNKNLTFREGVIAPWANNSSKLYVQTLESLGRHYNFNLDTAFNKLNDKVKNSLLYGSENEKN